MVKKHKLEDLNTLYRDAETIDAKAFSEMRSNILLVSGDHYTKRNNKMIDRIRASRDIEEPQKIRLSMNHMEKICDTYSNFISSAAPGVCFKPKTEKELSDIKSAELHEAVWRDAKVRHNYEEIMDESLDNFITLAEEWAIIKWDYSAGKIKGYKQAIQANGEVVEVPVMEGEANITLPYAFDMLVDPKAKDLKRAQFFIHRYVANVDDLKEAFPDVADKIKEGEDKTFSIFDSSKGDYRDSTTKETTVREFYFKKCARYPTGYFYIATEDVILAEGEIPDGVFPVVYQLYKKLPTHRRGVSVIRRLRPYQREINRAWSKMAEHQITLGDDKVLMMNGTQASDGLSRPGIDIVNVSGEPPVVIPGRDGAQYLNAALQTIDQMYKVANLDDSDDTSNLQDAFAILYKSASQKKKFKTPIKRHERFLKNFAMLYETLAKMYMPDDYIIQAISRSEAINMPEFKNSRDIHTQVVVEEQNEDLESKFGRQLSIQQTLQYVGSKLEPEQIGALLRSAPFGVQEGVVSDLTLQYDTATNLILALDRGEDLPTSKYINHDYMIKRLEKRMSEADFLYLDPRIQNMYAQKKALFEEQKAQSILEIQRVEQGLIPTGGGLVSMDFYVQDPNSPNKLMRAKAPQEAIAWFFKQLESQQWIMDPMQQLSKGSQEEIAQKTNPQLQGGAQEPATPWQANTVAGQSQMAKGNIYNG